MTQIVVCPHCHAKHPASHMYCTKCGERLKRVERIEKKAPPSIKIQRLHLPISLGIFVLIILIGSVIFQQLHVTSRLIFIAGLIFGFGIFYLRIDPQFWQDSTKSGESPPAFIPEWIRAPIGLLLLISTFLLCYGREFVLDWLFSQDVEERVVSLVLGFVFGGATVLSMNYLLRTIAQLRLRL